MGTSSYVYCIYFNMLNLRRMPKSRYYLLILISIFNFFFCDKCPLVTNQMSTKKKKNCRDKLPIFSTYKFFSSYKYETSINL